MPGMESVSPATVNISVTMGEDISDIRGNKTKCFRLLLSEICSEHLLRDERQAGLCWTDRHLRSLIKSSWSLIVGPVIDIALTHRHNGLVHATLACSYGELDFNLYVPLKPNLEISHNPIRFWILILSQQHPGLTATIWEIYTSCFLTK